MADLLPATTYTDGEEVNEANLYLRVFTPINVFYQSVLAAFVGDTGWQALAMTAPWVAGSVPPAYRVLNGVVHLDGNMSNGAVGANAFVLPAGARPLNIRSHLAYTGGPGIARLTVMPTGAVQVAVYLTGGTNSGVQLTGLTFPADG